MAEKVQLYVYDLSGGLARTLSGQLLGKQIDGVWHTSVAVGGIEYYFSAGVQSASAGKTHFGAPEKVIDLGQTEVPKEVREELIRDMAVRFTPETYNLISNNCNNFSDELATMLTGKGIPSDILSVPHDVLSTPFGSMLRPFLDQMQGQLGNITEGPRSQSITWMAAPTQAQHPSPSMPRKIPSEAPKDQAQRRLNKTNVETLRGVASETNAQAQRASQDMSVETTESNLKAVFQAALKREYTTLMAEGGLTPNQAAAMALQRVREQHQCSTMPRAA